MQADKATHWTAASRELFTDHWELSRVSSLPSVLCSYSLEGIIGLHLSDSEARLAQARLLELGPSCCLSCPCASCSSASACLATSLHKQSCLKAWA